MVSGSEVNRNKIFDQTFDSLSNFDLKFSLIKETIIL